MSALEIRSLSAGYGASRILEELSFDVAPTGVTAIVGPSGSGKTSLLRTVTRLDEDQEGYWVRGSVRHDGRELLGPGVDTDALRRRIGLVFQKPLVFPTSIEGNVLFGVRHRASVPRARWPAIVRETLEAAALWDEVAKRLDRPARELSQGQQQRLSIARALAIEPEILMLDETTASLDPRSAGLIEELVQQLGTRMSVILVTHDLAQARRASTHTVFLDQGRVVEAGPTARMFEEPAEPRTREYVQARRGGS